MKVLAALLEREAGHILVGLLLLFVGAGFVLLSIPRGDEVIVAALTLIARAMMANGRQHE